MLQLIQLGILEPVSYYALYAQINNISLLSKIKDLKNYFCIGKHGR